MTSTSHTGRDHRWLILAVLGLAQLMVVLDVTVVNIALPSAQEALGFSDADRQWLVTAYTLAFGGLLLLAGRIGDLLGRKRIFIVGLVGFALASALGGAAQSLGLLIAARALQGVFGALLAPAALSLLTTTFTDPTERGKAFGIFGAIGVGGGAVGLLLGGALTEYLSWRWCMYINIPIALVAAAGAVPLLSDQARTARVALDLPGTLTATLGLVALVYGFAQAEADGWGATSTLGFIALGVVLLAAFVGVQRRAAHPLLPLRIVLDRARGGAFLALAVNTAALLSVFLFLTYYLQQNLGLSPVMTGLAFLPSPIATALGATQGATRLARRFGARLVIPGGMALAALGMVLLAQLDTQSTYPLSVLPGLVLMSFGLGCVTGLAMGTATAGVEPTHAGAAGAAVNAMQQVGGSLGTALLSTLAVSATADALTGTAQTPQLLTEASVHGYTTAFWVSAALLTLGAAVSAALLHGAQPHGPVGETDSAAPAEPALTH
ncbi:MFS transporter [Couchioplanes caeruleus]|uniref:Puromycin resistance protein pur8 n=2 Tax=Couchioplanes caeruleus TaxID=56438 RepID=A0A1K0FBY4_9ACTN|nr:MFS transporter [Couchioplanes caeruleus]OJF10359.1 Puromycin resistance protein pur8 [Couchioplanes caeruleus subsp. caeruleus]ROP32297.1 EmrB/QacA subfamily drug resistance transporter [Couchioplanes caeruleus]